MGGVILYSRFLTSNKLKSEIKTKTNQHIEATKKKPKNPIGQVYLS